MQRLAYIIHGHHPFLFQENQGNQENVQENQENSLGKSRKLFRKIKKTLQENQEMLDFLDFSNLDLLEHFLDFLEIKGVVAIDQLHVKAEPLCMIICILCADYNLVRFLTLNFLYLSLP